MLGPPGMLQTLRGMMPGQASRSPAPAHQPEPEPSTPEQLVDLVKKRYTWAKDAKKARIQTWATCLAFYVGEHYRQWDNRAQRLVNRTKVPSWRVLLADNQIPGLVDTAAAKLARARQMPRGLPNTGEPEDEDGAAAATKALEHWWHIDGMAQKELEANVYRLIFGSAFFHAQWDPTKLARVPVVQGYTVDQETGEIIPQTQGVMAPVGDFCASVLTPFDIFPQPVERWADVGWVDVVQQKPLEWFKDTFENGWRVVPERGNETETVMSSLLPDNLRSDQSIPSGEGMATLHNYYERPCRRYPEGRHVMATKDLLLFHADKLPLPGGQIPVAMVGYRLVPKSLWTMGLIEHVIGLQRELNRGQSYMSENLRFFARPKWIAPRTAKLDHNAITSAPNEVIEYNAAPGIPAPQPVPPPALPAWLSSWAEEKRLAIQQVAGQHEVSNSGTPSGVTAGVAIDLLQQQDDARLSGPNLLGKAGLEALSGMALKTIVERWREKRLIATIGRNKAREVQALAGADIGDRDVLVEITEGVSDTVAAKRQRAMDYMAAGLFSGAYPMPLVFAILEDLEEHGLIEALRQAVPQIQAEQAMAELAAAEQGEEAALMEQEQAAAAQGQEQQGAEAQRAHEMGMAQLKGGQAMQLEQVRAASRQVPGAAAAGKKR